MRRLKNRLRSRSSRSKSPLPTQSSLNPGASPLSTKTSQNLPTQVITNTSTAAAHVSSSSAPLEKGQNYGIKVIYDGDEASVDIVFVHGLTGNAYNTWLHQDSGVHWPQDLLKKDITDARILSFGYDADVVNFWTQASRSGLSNVAEEMVRDLVRKRQQTETETRRILFVAHSLGGLVLKHALCYSRKNRVQSFDQIERQTSGIIFLGVPHCGSDLASWANFGTQMINLLRRANTNLVGVLRPDSEMLRLLENDFHDVLKIRTYEGSEILITCFYEELDVIGVGKIVPLHSAEIKGYGCFPIRANHMDMTKFPSSTDRGYQALLGELQSWKRPTPKAIGSDPLQNTPVSVGAETSNRRGLASRTMNDQSSHQFGHTSGWSGQNFQGTFHGDLNFNVQTMDSPKTNDHKMAEQWMVPRSASKIYTGRATLDNRLAEAFSFKLSDTPVQQRCFVIIGVGGTGKSEVCLKFAEVHRDEYWGVFWLNASSTTTAEQGYIEIGQRCGVTAPSAESVKAWLACSKKRWLLIIDNADNPEMDCSKYMPSGNRGDILITTRNRECEEYNTVGIEILDNLEPQFAQQLLLRTAGVKDNEWKKKEEAALTVVRLLGSHTLAIIQTGAFIKQRFCTFEEYPEYFQKQKRQLLEFHSNQNLSTYGNVFATFEVSAQYLHKSKQPENLDALDLLHTLAFMHNNGIAEKIFQRASEYAMELRDRGPREHETVDFLSISLTTRISKLLLCEWSNYQDRSRFRKARSILEHLSIITVRDVDGSTTISMHPLIHTWAKERQDNQCQCQAWQSAATILALSCQGRYYYIPELNMLQPHIQACVYHDINKYTLSMSDIETAQIYVQLAYALYCVQNYDSASFLVEKLYSRLQDRLQADQDPNFHINSLTGRVFMHEQRFEEGIQIFKGIVENRSQTMVENDPRLLFSQYNLAVALLKHNQISDAIVLLEKIVKIEENLAENDPLGLLLQHVLAHAYLRNQQTEKAMFLFEHVVKVQENLSETHPARLTSEHQLALTYLSRGQIDQAVKYFQHVVNIRKKILPENHSDRLKSECFLAVVYKIIGRLDEAVMLLEHVVKIVSTKYPANHSIRLISQRTLAKCYWESGQDEKALEIEKKIEKGKEQGEN